MNRFWIAVSVLATTAWAASPPGAFAQCCGGGGHAQQAPPLKAEPQPPQTDRPTAQPTKGPQLPLCPVTGDPIDFALKTVAADGPVYFSSEAAINTFKENPEAYAAKVNEQRAVLAKLPRVQANCPVMGGPIDGSTFIYTEGQGIYFCCPGCPQRYMADAAKYKVNLAASYTYQTRCPVDGETIDPTVYTDLPTGQRIYFCGKGDIETFSRDPATYAPKLAAQGINIEAPQSKDRMGKAADLQRNIANPAHQGHGVRDARP
jgi:YHS domain-containing protein